MQSVVNSDHLLFRNILVATDFSPASLASLHYAASFARQYQAMLTIAHILPPDAPPAALTEAWREGQRVETDLLVAGPLRDLRRELIVRSGEIWEGLSSIAKEREVDAMVVGTRGRTGLARVLLGSVAERIFRNATCPVLTVGPRAPSAPNVEPAVRRILFPTDFTLYSVYALSYAVSLAKHFGAHLSLLHVAQDAPGETGGSMEARLADARARLSALLPVDSGLMNPPELVVGFGTPATRILAVSAEQSPDLIVLGLRQPADQLAGRRWTTASEVTGKAACAVLTVRCPETVSRNP